MKNYISENKTFYTLYFHLIRKHRGIRPTWFTKETQIYYDGYPRSGNTFLQHIFRNVFKDVDSVHHLHKVAPIKIALDKQIPVFILIRKPSDAITSNYLKHYSMRSELPEKVNIKLLIQLTIDYVNYYEFVYKERKKIDVIQFDSLINNPSQIIFKMGKSMEQDFEEEDINNAILSYSGATDKLGSSKPSDYKKNKKDELFKYLEEKQDYKRAVSIYNKIIKS